MLLTHWGIVLILASLGCKAWQQTPDRSPTTRPVPMSLITWSIVDRSAFRYDCVRLIYNIENLQAVMLSCSPWNIQKSPACLHTMTVCNSSRTGLHSSSVQRHRPDTGFHVTIGQRLIVKEWPELLGKLFDFISGRHWEVSWQLRWYSLSSQSWSMVQIWYNNKSLKDERCENDERVSSR